MVLDRNIDFYIFVLTTIWMQNTKDEIVAISCQHAHFLYIYVGWGSWRRGTGDVQFLPKSYSPLFNPIWP